MTTFNKLQKFIKQSVDNFSLLGLNQGVYTFRGVYIVDGQVREQDYNGSLYSNYAIWDYLGEPRLVDYDVEGARTSKFGDWPIITDIKWSKEVERGIVITTKPWECEDREYGRSLEEE
jgi:hypothetical protein